MDNDEYLREYRFDGVHWKQIGNNIDMKTTEEFFSEQVSEMIGVDIVAAKMIDEGKTRVEVYDFVNSFTKSKDFQKSKISKTEVFDFMEELKNL